MIVLKIKTVKFELQIIDLKSKDVWSSKFSSLQVEKDQIIFEAWTSLPESYNQLKVMLFGILTIVGFIYYSEHTFSNMKFLKCKLRSHLNDISLESCIQLKASTYEPNVQQINYINFLIIRFLFYS